MPETEVTTLTGVSYSLDPSSPESGMVGTTADNGKEIWSAYESAAHIARGYGSWADFGYDITDGIVISYSFDSAYFSSVGEAFDEDAKAAARQVLAYYAELVNVTFVEVTSADLPEGESPNMTFQFEIGSAYGGGWAHLPSAGGGNVNIGHVSWEPTVEVGNSTWGTIMHEVGHGMGLNHPGYYGLTNTGYEGEADHWNDTNQYSAMSYWSASNTGGELGGQSTIMLHDILALQMLYGANMSTRTGDTVYGYNSTAGTLYSLDDEALRSFSIWDAGGTDTLDLSGSTTSVVLDLREGGFSSSDGLTHNLSIAYGAEIENGIGGAYADTIQGNALDNLMRGGFGDDVIYGGSDTVASDDPRDFIGIEMNADPLERGQYLMAQNYSGFSNANGFTFEMMAQVIRIQAEGITFASYASTKDDNDILIYGERDGIVQIYVGGEAFDTTVLTRTLVDGEPHRLSVSWDKAKGALAFYVDGEVADSATLNAGYSIGAGGTLVIGQEQDEVGGGFSRYQVLSGTVGDIRVFDSARDADDIAADAFTALDAATEGLTTNWQVTADTSGEITDSVVQSVPANLTALLGDTFYITQSTTYNATTAAANVLDGDDATYSHTENNGTEWLEIRFNQTLTVEYIDLINRASNGGRLNGATVSLLDDTGAVIWTSDPISGAVASEQLRLFPDTAMSAAGLRIDQSGNYLQLAGVDVYGTAAEDATYTPIVDLTDALSDQITVSQSSDYNASSGVGLINDNDDATFNHTLNTGDEWLLMQFGQTIEMTKIEVVNRPTWGSRLNGATVSVLDENGDVVWTSDPISGASGGEVLTFALPWGTEGASVRIDQDTNFLHIAELNVYGPSGTAITSPETPTTTEATTLTIEGGATVTTTANPATGQTDADTIYGGEGNDTLYGGMGEDLLIGDGTDLREASDTFTLIGVSGDSKVSIDNQTVFPSGSFTVEFLWQQTALENQYYNFSFPGFAIYRFDTGATGIAFWNASESDWAYGIIPDTFTDGDLHRLSMTYDDSTGQFSVYIDGTLVNDATFTPGTRGNNDGLLPTDGSVQFSDEGLVGDVRIYDSALEAETIAANWGYALTDPDSEEGLVQYWVGDDNGTLVSALSDGTDMTASGDITVSTANTWEISHDDALYGGAASDTLQGGLGNDTLDGGDGADTAIYDGAYSAYTVTEADDGTLTVVSSLAADAGSDTLNSIETLVFADGTYEDETFTGDITTITVEDTTGTRSWTYYTDTFDASGTRVSREMLYDDGRLATTGYTDGTRTSVMIEDTANTRSWTSIDTRYDSAGTITQRTIAYDDGGTSVTKFAGGQRVQDVRTLADGRVTTTDYADGIRASQLIEDAGNTQTWSEIASTFDSAGQISSKTITYDDGGTSGSTYDAGIKVQDLRTYADGREATTDYTNGVRSAYHLADTADAFVWTTQDRTYDGAGNVLTNEVIYDNGRTILTDYDNGQRATVTVTDGGNQYRWDTYTDSYNTEGLRTTRVMTLDDGRIIETVYIEDPLLG